jgi:hypothetical protein
MRTITLTIRNQTGRRIVEIHPVALSRRSNTQATKGSIELVNSQDGIPQEIVGHRATSEAGTRARLALGETSG